MIDKQKIKETISRRIWTIAAIAVILVLGICYLNRYRITLSPIAIIRTSSISITSPEAGADIFLGDEKIGTTGERGTEFSIKNLYPGQYAIIVSKKDFWPWAKPIAVTNDSVTHLSPFITPQEASTSPLLWNDPEFESISARLYQEQSTQSVTATTSADGHAALWVENNTIFARWENTSNKKPESYCNNVECSATTTVIQSIETIHSADFYGTRNDIIVFSTDSGVYTLEVDKRGIQNFQPLFKGVSPVFITSADRRQLFILSENTINTLTINQ